MLDVDGAQGAAPTRVAFGGDAVVRLPDRSSRPARVELVVGRTRYSVGGRINESPRWWRGRLYWERSGPEIPPGAEVFIDLEDGWSGVAVVEPSPTCEDSSTVIRGIGPAPFQVS